MYYKHSQVVISAYRNDIDILDIKHVYKINFQTWIMNELEGDREF